MREILRLVLTKLITWIVIGGGEGRQKSLLSYLAYSSVKLLIVNIWIQSSFIYATHFHTLEIHRKSEDIFKR